MSSPAPGYHGYRFPPDIIAHAVWLYFRFSLLAFVMWRTSWPSEALRSPMRRSDGGVARSAARMPAGSGTDAGASETRGISMSCSSP